MTRSDSSDSRKRSSQRLAWTEEESLQSATHCATRDIDARGLYVVDARAAPACLVMLILDLLGVDGCCGRALTFGLLLVVAVYVGPYSN